MSEQTFFLDKLAANTDGPGTQDQRHLVNEYEAQRVAKYNLKVGGNVIRDGNVLGPITAYSTAVNGFGAIWGLVVEYETADGSHYCIDEENFEHFIFA